VSNIKLTDNSGGVAIFFAIAMFFGDGWGRAVMDKDGRRGKHRK